MVKLILAIDFKHGHVYNLFLRAVASSSVQFDVSDFILKFKNTIINKFILTPLEFTR